MVWDGTLPAFPIEPLVGSRVSADGQSECLRLPAIFVHPCLEREDGIETPCFKSQVTRDNSNFQPLHQTFQKLLNLFQNFFR